MPEQHIDNEKIPTRLIGAIVNLVKEESDIPCAVYGRIREIHEKRDSVKKKTVCKRIFHSFSDGFLFLASEALFCRKCFRLVVTHPILPDGYKLASRLSITFRTETLFLLLPQTRYNLTAQLNDVPVPALLPALRTRKLHAFLLVCCNMPDINSPDINRY